LVSLFQSKTGENYIFTWVDREERLDRWLVFQVTNDQLERYLRSQDPLKHPLMHPKPGYLFAVDMQTEWRPLGAVVLAPSQLPNDYIPEEDSFYQGTLNCFSPRRDFQSRLTSGVSKIFIDFSACG
jgi:hypothetical protein